MVLGLDFGEDKKKEKEPIPVPKIATFAEEGKSDYMAPAMRQYLLEKWEKSTEEERQTTVSIRSRTGMRCHICGRFGYFREICPTGCESPPPTPDSMASTPPATPPPSPPGLGIIWGNIGFAADEYESPAKTKKKEEEKKKSGVNKKADLRPLRENSNEAKEDLRVSDFSIGGFEFFANAEEGYSRTIPELSLHQVLRRLMRLLERDLIRNAEKLENAFDVTLLHPPSEKDRDVFYTEAVGKIKKHKEYFIKRALKDERTARLAYKFQGGLRPDDQLDSLFRGKSDGMQDLRLFKTDPKAGATMHSKIGWKSNLARHDQLAVSDPTALAKSEAVEKLFKEQGAWTEKQRKDMEFRNNRYEHLLQVIRWEMKEEHNREAKELSEAAKGKKEGKAAKMAVWLERLNSIDEIMMLLKEYGITGALDEADLLIYQVDKWAEEMKKHAPVAQSRRGAKAAAAAQAEEEKRAIEEGGDVHGGSKGVLGEGEGHHSDAFLSIADAVHKEAVADKNRLEGNTAPGTADTTKGRAGRKGGKGVDKKDKEGSEMSGVKTVGNAMMTAGASPYYESDVAIERHKRLSKRLSIHWKKKPKQVSRSDLVSPVGSAVGGSRSLASGYDDSTYNEGHDGDDDSTQAGDDDSLAYSDAGSAFGLGSPSPMKGQNHGAHGPGGVAGEKSSVSFVRNGRVRIVPNSIPVMSRQKVNTKVTMKQDEYDALTEAAHARQCIKKELRRKYRHGKSMHENEVLDRQDDAHREAKELKDAEDRKKHQGWKAPTWKKKAYIPPHEVDEMAMAEMREKFINAGLGNNIRKGRQDDLAWAVPSLIPVPGAFEGDDTQRLKSVTGAKIVDGLQDRMVSDMGHTERRLLPLYVRNTLIEVNGTSANGDQTQEVLSRDRRYSHYHGRPLIRFEPGKKLVDSREFIKNQGTGFGPNKKEASDRLAPVREEKERQATLKRIEEQTYKPMNRSLVRLVFGKPLGNPKDLMFSDVPV
jgi:hypothetical protein